MQTPLAFVGEMGGQVSLPLPCSVLSRLCGRWLEADFPRPRAGAECFGASEMPGGWQIVSVQSISHTKAQRAESTGLIYFVYFAEEIALPWSERSED